MGINSVYLLIDTHTISNTPDTLDCYTFRSADSGGAGDEFFEGGDGILKVYAIAHKCTSATLVIEVM
ncbi:hypothetical protein VCSRO105_0672 [Vibrio cholerae]|nr:hypothetical protein DN30_1242 [Vibrio cholerae]GHW90170.1 hypothetical protein VCSRO105_0672 [Vibrio cholerae]